jgi:hypothetical protein
MAEQDDIGSRGEDIFCVRITDFCGRKKPYFRPRFLGEKAQTSDFLVELVGAGKRTMFFFVQVKTTHQGYTRRGRPPRLKVSMSGRDVRRLALYPAPTYLGGSTGGKRWGTFWRSSKGCGSPSLRCQRLSP